MDNRPTSRSCKGHAGKTAWNRRNRERVPRWKAPRVRRMACFFAEARRKRPLGRARGESRVARRRASRKQARRARSFGSEPRWSRKRSLAIEASSGLPDATRTLLVTEGIADRERRLLQPAGPRAHDRRCLGNVGLGSAPSRREKSRRGGARHGESRDHGPLIHETPAGSPRKRRVHPETAPGEGNLTTARVTSRSMERGFGPSS